MNDIASYVQFVMTQTTHCNHHDKHKVKESKSFDDSRQYYKHLSAVIIFNALTGSTDYEDQVNKALADSTKKLKLINELQLMESLISKKFRDAKFINKVNFYVDKLSSSTTQSQ